MFSFFNLEKYYSSVKKYQWRETIAYIEDNAGYGDYVAVNPEFEIESVNYYRERKDLNVFPLKDESLLRADIGNKSLWLVLADHASTRKKEFEEAMGEKYDLLEEKKFKLLNLYKYHRK